MGLIRSLDELDPEFLPIVRQFRGRLEAAGLRHYIVETRRTQDVQDAYFAQGRQALAIVNAMRVQAGLFLITEKENRNTVTDSRLLVYKGVGHGNGTALDICLLNAAGKPSWKYWEAPDRWLAMGEIGELCGLEWGGRREPIDKRTGLGWDPPHFQKRRLADAA